MGCDIVFVINGEEISLKDTGLEANSSLKDIANYLSGQPEFRLYLNSKFKSVKQKFNTDLSQYTTGLTGNYTVKTLQDRYPSLTWPTSQLGFSILAVNSYTIKDNLGKTISGPLILANGTILININNRLDVLEINAYLTIKDMLENLTPETEAILELYSYIIEDFKKEQERAKKVKEICDKNIASALKLLETETDADEIQKLNDTIEYNRKRAARSHVGLIDVNPDIASILLHFMTNSDLYKNLVSNEKTMEYSLTNLYNLLLDKTKHNYGNDLTNQINDKIDKKNKTISLKDLLEIVTATGKYAEVGKILTNPKKSPEEKIQFCKTLFEDTSIDFSYIPESIKGNTLQLKYFSETFNEKYGNIFNLRTMKNLTPIQINGQYNYKGYHIYKWEGYGYVYSKGVITEYSYGSNLYLSIDELKKLIDKKAKNDTDSFYGIHIGEENTVYIPYAYKEGTILEILDSRSLNLEKINYNKDVIDLFYNINTTLNQINNHLLRVYNVPQDTFDTKEKALLFLHYKLLNPKISTREAIETINNLKYRYVYVEKVKSVAKKNYIPYTKKSAIERSYAKKNQTIDALMYEVRMFDINLDKDIDLYIPKYDHNGLVAVRNILTNIASIMSDKFGVPIEVLTLSEIEDMFPEVDAKAKAFIRLGTIYVNSSAATSEDLFHEYAHIFLGVLKATNYNLYEKIIDAVAKDEYSQMAINKKILDNDEKLARLDILEEVFADKFGAWLAGRPKGLSKTLEIGFAKAKKQISEGMNSIFNENEEGKDLFGDSIRKMMSKFTDNIYLLMEGKGDIQMQLNQSAVYRLATNWIAELLKNEQLLEEC